MTEIKTISELNIGDQAKKLLCDINKETHPVDMVLHTKFRNHVETAVSFCKDNGFCPPWGIRGKHITKNSRFSLIVAIEALSNMVNNYPVNESHRFIIIEDAQLILGYKHVMDKIKKLVDTSPENVSLLFTTDDIESIPDAIKMRCLTIDIDK